MDMSPVRTTGTIRSNRARILHTAGITYHVTAGGNVTAWPTPEPERDVVGWHVQTPDGVLRWSRSGCSCANPAGKLSVEQIVGSV